MKVFLVILLGHLTFSVLLTSLQHPASTQASISGSIVLNVTVTNRSGEAVMGLDKSAFTLYDNNVVQAISYVENASQPLSVGIIVGMHGLKASLDRREEAVETLVKQGLSGFIQASHRNNRYFLGNVYRGGVEYLSDWSQDGSVIIDRVDKAKFQGGPLLDACYDGVEKLINEGNQKRVLLVVSDGMDDNSHRKLEELRRLIKGSDVLIYCIPLTPSSSSDSSLYLEGLGFLDEIATKTGGRLYQPKTFSVISNIFALIALELGHQYSVGYTPLNFIDDGKEHHIKLEVKAPTNNADNIGQLIIRSRESYLPNRRLLKTRMR